ncbi:hypothetical protein [Erythrobacter neustonensis]|uniref:hypothetical protein n=1 Tax=Erythrobacter neustonensis TaxID=1112 RepID=UPI0018D2D6D6|nr:hypothetical protein [Erythrobacter neustonensis]
MQNDISADQSHHADVAAFLAATEALIAARVKQGPVDCNFLTVAGATPSHPEFSALKTFSQTSNWHLLYAYNPLGGIDAFDPANVRFLCVLSTDAYAPIFLNTGRLWVDKNSGRLAIAFSDGKLHLKLTVDPHGKIVVREKTHPFAPEGYELALNALRKKQERDNRRFAVLTAIGTVPCTMDAHTLHRALEGSTPQT